MTKKITLTESELINFVKLIAEEINWALYDHEDYYDLFFQTFRKWLIENKGEKVLSNTMSVLMKKYSKEFANDILDDNEFEELDYLDWTMVRKFIENAVKQGKLNLPTLEQEKITDKYGTYINDFLKTNLSLPNYMTANLYEPQPMELILEITIDFMSWIKDPKGEIISRIYYETILSEFLINYFGVEFGELKYGEAELRVRIDFVNDESFFDKDLKKIKSEFKKLNSPSAVLKSVSADVNRDGLSLWLTFPWTVSNQSRLTFKRKCRDVLNKLGYGPIIRVYIK